MFMMFKLQYFKYVLLTPSSYDVGTTAQYLCSIMVFSHSAECKSNVNQQSKETLFSRALNSQMSKVARLL